MIKEGESSLGRANVMVSGHLGGVQSFLFETFDIYPVSVFLKKME